MTGGIRVVHYTPVWLSLTERWLYDQVMHLPAWVENHVVCESTSNLGLFAIPNLQCNADVSNLRRYWARGLRKLRVRNYLGYVAERLRKLHPQIVHSHYGPVAWQNCPVVARVGAKHVATFYGFDVNRAPAVDPRWRGRYRQLFAKIDRVLCEGPHMASCVKVLGCPEEKIRVHHLGVRVDEIPYRPRHWRAGTPLRVLIAATFREKKGVPFAIAALGALRREVPLEVTVIGDSTAEPRDKAEKEQILRTLESAGLKSSTRLLGFRSYQELVDEAYQHHIFVSPSLTASDGDTEGGAPITLIQMAASGMPIVSTRHCDIPNVLPQNALLAEERDVSGLVERLRWLVDNSDNWEPLLLAARRHVETDFDASIQGRRLGGIYAELLDMQLEPVQAQTDSSMAVNASAGILF